MSQQFWKITDFAERISKDMQLKFNDEQEGVHYNTVDKWFKTLESKHIHYVGRVTDEKVYDELDLAIGCFIYERRREKWTLSMIFDTLHNHFELRPVPKEGSDDASLLASLDMKKEIERQVALEIDIIKAEMELAMRETVAKEFREFQSQLPQPVDKVEEKQSYMLTGMKINMKLEQDALDEWNSLPEQERMKKAGLFRKEEDIAKRDDYIRRYKKKNMEAAVTDYV